MRNVAKKTAKGYEAHLTKMHDHAHQGQQDVKQHLEALESPNTDTWPFGLLRLLMSYACRAAKES